jgi:OOP family OmpA-OmpF porin
MMAVLLLVSMAATGCAGKGLKAYAMAGLAQAMTSPKPDQFSGDEDERDTGGQIGGGVIFNQYLAVEAAYVDLGTTSFRGLWDRGGGDLVSDEGTIDRQAIRASVLGMWPITARFSLFAKGGMCRWKAEEDEVFDGTPESHEADGTDPVLGVGVGFDLTHKIGFRGEWERFLDVGEVHETGQDDVDFVSANVVVKF